MNQYRLSNNSRVNQSGTVAQPQKLTFLQKLYKSIMKALAFINLRGRQLLWIGSTGNHFIIQGSLLSCGL